MSKGGPGLFFHFPLPNKSAIYLILYRKKKINVFSFFKIKDFRLKIHIKNSRLKRKLVALVYKS